MLKPGTDETNVQFTDVLCDFCQHEWSEDRPMVEGHRGCMICGNCLAAAYVDVINDQAGSAPADFTCTMCRERPQDRAELQRESEPAWQSPAYPEAVICRRCIKLAAGVLQKDPDYGWKKPASD